MDLFKILGTIAIDNSGAIKVLDDTTGKAKQTAGAVDEFGASGEKSGSKFGNAMKKVGKAAVNVAKVVGTGMIAAGTAVAGLVTKSVQAYADYEQLVGGVETLFGAGGQTLEEFAASVGKSVDEASAEYDKLMRSQKKVLENSKNAFKTAGLSANDYMETVTSFSASLLQSLGGDTEKAAEVADRAIIDMADNANKMGTSMELIQNAYNGFAKANYTMLDNLKLGYGGTQEEMKRLISDAAKMTDVQKELGVTVDANSMSFGNIVNAISVMQESMGIAGTTAKEASSTISGSIASMKAAWTNLTVAMSDDNADFGEYVNNFVSSVSTVADNLMPRISIALNGVVQLVEKLAPVIIGKIPELFNTLLPAVISAATGLITAIVNAFPGIVSAIMTVLPELIRGFQDVINGLVMALPSIIQALLDALPTLITSIVGALTSVIVTICTTLPKIIQPIFEELPGLIALVVESILDAVPALLTGIIVMITEVINMLPQILPVIVDAIKDIITMLGEQLPVIVDQLFNGVMQIITMLVEMLPELIPDLVNALADMVMLLVDQLPTLIPQLIQGVIQIITMLCDSLPVILPVLITAILDIVTMLLDQLPVLIPVLIQAVVDIIMMLVEQLPVIIPMILDAVISLTMGIIDALIAALPEILKALIVALPSLLKAVWEAIKMVFVNSPEWFGKIYASAVQLIFKAFEVVGAFFKGIWEGIKGIFANIGEWFSEKFSTAEESVTNAWSTVKQFFSDIWNGITSVFSNVGGWFSEKFNSAKNNAVNAFSNVKAKFTEIKDNVLNAFSSIKTKLAEPFEKAKETISKVADKIFGLFKGEISMPKIKKPHFSISPSGWSVGDLLKGKIPKLSIDWYAKAMDNPMIMTRPTIFGYDGSTGQLMGGGEAGSEVVSGTNTLMQMIQSAVSAQNDTMTRYLEAIIDMLADYFPDALDAMRTPAVFDPEYAAMAMAVPMDRQLGILAAQKGRGR